MSGPGSATEVAEDYQQALDDLTMNSRIEIGNLTSVAKDSLQHAHAIAEVLQNHIKKVPPNRTLPALYVLDSIVKNVGTPYTLYFGKNLFGIFMNAYTKVDNGTRRKMDEMLQTWKQPVPGSMTKLPVFPSETTRPIENALVGARNAAHVANQSSYQKQQQMLGRGRPPPPQRDTPTPPNARPGAFGHPLPAANGPNGPYGNPNGGPPPPPPLHAHAPNAYPGRSTPQSMPTVGAPHYPQPSAYGSQPGVSVEKIKQDLQQLIVVANMENAQSPQDTRIQTKLKALLDLQTFLQSQNLSQDQLMLVKSKVTELTSNVNPGMHEAMPAQPPQFSAALPAPVSYPPKTGTPVSLDAIFGQGALASILAGTRQSATPQATPPYLPPPPVAIRSPAPERSLEANKSATPISADPQALLAALRQSGMLPPASAPPTIQAAGPRPAIPPPPGPSSTPLNLASMPGLAALLAAPKNGGHMRSPSVETPGAYDLKPAFLKQWRPELLPQLYERLGPPCTQCGRRFKNDEAGRVQKTAHMDWHFRVNQRIAEAEKRGQHRSYYVDETDWVRSREAIDTDYVPVQPDDTAAASGVAGKGRKLQYMPVPEDPRINTMCPICQEKFEMKWLDEAQEWVWMDAVKVGDRVYHASCHREATNDGNAARNTPDRVLGKRKAEDDYAFRPRIKAEGY